MMTSRRTPRRLSLVALCWPLVALATSASACRSSAAVTAPGTLASSTAPRITIAAPPTDLAAAVTGNAQLALDLHRALVATAPAENLVFSPYSISLALAMAYAGAAGPTHDAFDRVLHQALPEPAYHRALNDLDRQLASRGQGARATDGQPFRLDVTNQLFADERATFVPAYLDTLATEYGVGVRLLDFRGAPEPSRQLVNGWVDQKTGGKIPELLPEGFVTRDTRAVLVNAIYLDAAWNTKFDPGRTSGAPFRTLDGSTATVQMMRNADVPALAATVDGVEVVSLPYDGKELSLLVLMPPAGSFTVFEQALGVADIERYAAARRAEHLALSMPRFQIRTSAPLRQTLSDLGLAPAFDPDRADFSRMSPERLVITDVIHQALVIVDESGTVAAGATGIGFGAVSLPVTRPIVLDRPFVYLVRDEATGAILFLGRYVRPSS